MFLYFRLLQMRSLEVFDLATSGLVSNHPSGLLVIQCVCYLREIYPLTLSMWLFIVGLRTLLVLMHFCISGCMGPLSGCVVCNSETIGIVGAI